jgi:hypothetical protein
MKILGSVFIIICFFLFSSCKSNSSSPTDSGGLGGPGGGGGGGVTFGITQAAGNTGIIFYATPSTAVVITNVNVSVPAASFTKDYTDATGTIYPANQAVEINEFTGVASGQKWIFVFTGHLGTATGTAFTATSNYTVP